MNGKSLVGFAGSTATYAIEDLRGCHAVMTNDEHGPNDSEWIHSLASPCSDQISQIAATSLLVEAHPL